MRLVIAALLSLASLAGVTLPPQEPPEKKFLTADGSRPGGLFAPGVAVGKTVFIAGKGDYRPQDELPGKVRNCLAEVEKALKVAGLGLGHVVSAQCYLEDPAYYAGFNEVYREFFPNRPPARTTVAVPNVPGDSRIEITCIAYSDPAEVKQVGPPAGTAPYSSGILAGETLHISGKGDQRPDGSHPDSFEEQVRQTMNNVEATLRQAGLDFRHVVFSNVYLDKRENLASFDRAYGRFFKPGEEPARATTFVDWIPGGSHVEITCTAVTDLKRRKVVRPPSMPPDRIPGASPAVWGGDLLYLSGLAGQDASGTAPDLEKQTRLMARNHTEILTQAGLAPEDIVSGHVYLADIADYKAFNDVYAEYYSKGPGVRTCLMPFSAASKDAVRVRASFIAARTRR